MESTRKHPRQKYADAADIPVTVIQFGRLERLDLTVRGIDISDGGMGIETNVLLSPGFLWFGRPVGSHAGGMIVWGRKVDKGYRAGIQFLPMPLSPHDYLQVNDA